MNLDCNASQASFPRMAIAACAFLFAIGSASAGAQDTGQISSSSDYNSTAGAGSPTLSAPQPSMLAERRNGQGGGGYGYKSHDWLSVNHLAFEAGGGFSKPTGNTKAYQNLGWSLKVGGGYNLNKRFTVMMDYDYASFGVPSSILNQVNPQGGGGTHLWSLTLNPIFNYKTSGRFGGYVVGGGGFYRKLVNFTQPFNDNCAYFDPFYGCIPGTVNQTVAHFSNNAGGLNLGTGFTYKLSDTGNWKLFAEARYVWVDNQPSANSMSSTGYAPSNFRTQYIPITFGVRF